MHAGGVAKEHDLLEWMPDAVVVSNREGRIVYANRQAEKLTGYRRKELIGRDIEVLVPAVMRKRHLEHRKGFYARGVARLMGTLEDDFRLWRKDRTTIPVEISLGPAGDDTVAVIRDFTDRRRIEAALEHRALHDPLTELANRTLFFDRLRQSIHAARREGQQFALVMLDLDGFKAINDTLGHAAGDLVLKTVAGRLRLGLRATDTAARLGGDEFAWILPRITSRRSVEAIVRKRLVSAQQPVVVDGRRIDVGVSAGIALFPEEGRNPDALMRKADVAMYTAKRRRRLLTV
jgi:diguanylate cyclase (GGDEF)-like protein/PAS domain S-box-containing protein